MKRAAIEKKLKRELDKERYTHTIGVMYTAASLAMAYNVNIEQAMYAGLLHDCAKCISNITKLKICKKHKIEITPAEERNPFLLHAKLGAYLAKKVYKIKNEEILHAISVHTTGAPGMNTLDKIIYIADYIEPGRTKAPNLREVRKLAFEDLDRTMLKILADTLDYLDKNKELLDPMTMEAYRYFQNQSRTKDGRKGG